VASFRQQPVVSAETCSPIFKSLGNLYTQSEWLLKAAQKKKEGFQNESGQDLLFLCRRISNLQQRLCANPRTPERADSTRDKEDIPPLIDPTDNETFAYHSFAPITKKLQSSPPRRFRRILTQIAMLKTGLRPGIFVRYAKLRPDVMKILTIGLGDTPFENVIFEFDLWRDADFSKKLPAMKFKTTGSGEVGFTPKLHENGRVCWSLLGTWQGSW
jgi:hypothetical protein